MFASFSTALSAMDANSTAVDVVGNNLANLNTPGYKESVAYFHDLVSASMAAGTTQLGFGVASPLTLRQFTQGAIQSSGGPLDAAIQGDGFFVVRSGAATEYTRAGSFQVDLSGNLLTPTGEHVQGWTASNGVVNTGGPTGDIVVPVGAMQTPVVTQNFSLDANMDASAAVGSDSSWSTPVQIYDSLGTAHVLTVTFQKSDLNKWDYSVTIPGEDLAGGTAGTPSELTKGTLTFNPDGTLKDPAAGSPISFDIKGLASGANDLTGLNWNLYNADGSGRLTQFGESSAASAISQDGSGAAQLTQVVMGNGGQLLASYSNGKQAVVGQLAMASIRNPQSLVAVGNNNYQVSANTAPPAIGAPGTGGRGTIVGASLESSNVDIAREFTNLIVLQSAYQANAKVVTAVNQLSQATTNLIP
jgi:flagellar hook protein FlgE